MKRTLNSFCMGNLLAQLLFLFTSSSLFAFEGVEFRLRPHQIPKDYGPRDVQAEIEFAATMGLPVPDTVEDPKCVSTTGVWLVLIMGASRREFACHLYP